MAILLLGVANAAKPEIPPVDAVISKLVSELPEPSAPNLEGGVQLAISTADERAAAHVSWGLTCLHTGWDFEAYRHFCAALKRDPECLMAHWGVVVALLQGDAGLTGERSAAASRMLELADKNLVPDIEKRYVFALTKLLADGPQEAASAFGSIAENYPNDIQAAVLQSLFARGGYDEAGDATPDQVRAEESIRALAKQNPSRLFVRYALLAVRAEATTIDDDLALARELAAAAPDYPPVQHLLGHYEWRSGYHTRAAAAFAKSSSQFADWAAASKLQPVDCAGWTKAECYRAVALASKGDYEAALAAAKAVAAIEVAPAKAASEGGRMVLWEAKSLPARLLLRRADPGDYELALKSLPSSEVAQKYADKTLVVWSWQAISSVAAGKFAVEKGNLEEAREVQDDLTQVGENFVKTRQIAVGIGERSPWMRAFRMMEVMASELRGSIALAGDKDGRGSAFNWFQSAIDRQTPATLMMPPAVILPMEARMGDYWLGEKEWLKAIDVLDQGGDFFASDRELLTRLEVAFRKAGMPDEASKVVSRIDALKQE